VLQVYFPPLEAKVYMIKMAGGPELSVATAGESVELHCAAETSNPAPGFKWLRNGVEVTIA
jgi:hypothetical protein